MLTYRPAVPEDADICASFLAEGFLEPLRKLFGSGSPVQLLSDFLHLYMRSENRGYIVALLDEEVAGFILITKNLKRLLFKVIVRGILWIAWKVFTRKYRGLALGPLLASTLGSLKYYGENFAIEKKTNASAQVVIMAVSGKLQGRGIGKQLLWKGYDYLRKNGVTRLKLEVRTDNGPARHIYQKEGFVEIGRIESAVGTSVAMVKTIGLHETDNV